MKRSLRLGIVVGVSVVINFSTTTPLNAQENDRACYIHTETDVFYAYGFDGYDNNYSSITQVCNWSKHPVGTVLPITFSGEICSPTLSITVKSSGSDSDNGGCTVNNKERHGYENYSVDASFYTIPELDTNNVAPSNCISDVNEKKFTFTVNINSPLFSKNYVSSVYLQIASNRNFTTYVRSIPLPLPSGTATLSYSDLAGPHTSELYGKTLYYRAMFIMTTGYILYGPNSGSTTFYPDLKFDGDVIVETPRCTNDSPIIKIPASSAENYVISIKDINGGHGYNYLTSYLDSTTDGYYVIDNNTYCINDTAPHYTFGHSYILNIEQQGYSDTSTTSTTSTPCAYQDSFYIPEIPSFTVSHTGYGFNGTDNAGNPVQIGERGDSGRVNLRVVNSCTQSVTIRAGIFSRVDNLLESSVSNGRTYYSGNTYIEVPAGTYLISVQNDHCTASLNDSITLKEPPPISFSLSSTPISCHTSCFSGDTSNGTITVSIISGGMGSYSVSLDSGQYNTIVAGQYTFSGISFSENEHSVTVTDQYGNSTTNTISVGQNSPLTVQVSSISPTSLWCSGDGVVTLRKPQGGSAPYQYSSNNSAYQSGLTLYGYSAGPHYAYIKDSNNCVSRIEVNVPAPPGLEIAEQKATPPRCSYGYDGGYGCTVANVKGVLKAVLSPSPETANVEIIENEISIIGLSPGEYSLSITDSLEGESCTLNTTFKIPSKSEISLTLTVSNVTGKGTPTGSITVLASGGNPGDYSYFLYDEKKLQVDSSMATSLQSVTFNNLLGSPLSNGGKSYYIDVRDTKGCSYSQNDPENYYSDSIFEPEDTLSLTCEITDSLKCYGDGNAVVELSATGGWSERYLYSRDGASWDSSSTFNSFTAGSYTFYVEDTSGWRDTVTLTIPQPDRVSASIISEDVTCAGLANGSISISSPRGGSGVYSFRIRNDGVWKESSEVFQNLNPGEYDVYLKDSQNNCKDVQLSTIIIKEPGTLAFENFNIVQPICELSNGKISAEVKGGNGSYRYELWRNDTLFYTDSIFKDTTGYNIDSLSSGFYQLKVIDNKGCELESNLVELPVYYNPAVNWAAVDVRCYGETNGEVALSGYSGTGAFGYSTIRCNSTSYADTLRSWSNTVFMNLGSGSYSVSVFDSNGCVTNLNATIEVAQPDSLYVVVDSIRPVLTFNSPTGMIIYTIEGGNNNPKTVTLEDSLGTAVYYNSQRLGGWSLIIDSLYAGSYGLTVVDSKGCRCTSEPLEVHGPGSALGFTVVDKKDALCKSQTGSFTVQATGGWGDYKYKRSTQNSFYNSGKFENLYAGSYVVTVKDGYGATYSDTVVIHEPKDSLRAWVAELNNPTCEGNGSVVLGLNGGTAAYKIYNLASNDSLLVPGVQPVSITGLSAGDNQFRVVDGNGCRFNLETNLNNSRLLHVAFDTPTYPSTSSSSDGALSAVVTGGKSPYSYLWSSLFGTPVTGMAATLNNIPSGHYEVSVTEANGCNVTKDLYLPNISDLPLEICYKRDESSYRAGDGYCTLTAAEKNWSSFYIITPSKQKLTFNTTDSTSMFDFRADSVFLRNLEGGDYFIAGISTTNVKFYAEFTIKPYELFGFGKVDVLNASTIGASNGKITLDVIGGGGGNQFRWEKIVGTGAEPQVSQDNEASSILSSIPAGNYRVTVTDCFGNTITEDVKVDEPSSALMISVAESTNESCKDYTDAYVRLTAVGGWDDYQFRSQKSEYFGNSPLFSDLEVGTHRFYIIDKMGAVDSVEVNITEPNYLTSRIASIDSVSCNGLADGRVEFAVNGGTAPYRFADMNQSNLWIDDSVKGQLPAGKYRYIFTDSNKCIGQDTVEVVIPQPDSLLFNSIAVVHTTCEQDNGSIKVKLQGGTVPYRYEWFDSNGNPIGGQDSVGQLVQNGYYTLNVRDKNGCPQKLQQLINPSTNPKVTRVGTTDVVCYGESNGTATIQDYQYGSPSAPLTFTWSNGNTGLSASGYPSGIHHVTVTDTNSCSTVKYFDVVQPDLLRIAIVNSKMPKCFGYSDAFIEALGVGGVGGYSYLWSTGDSLSLLGNIGKGEYGLLLTDANGCEVYGVYPVGEPEELEVDLGDDILMCPGNTRVLDGQEFATHKWSTSQGEVSKERYFTVSKPDSYFLEVTDSIGCLAHDTVAVAIGNSALVADFLVSSGVVLGDTLILYELSNMPLDSMSWDYNNSAFLELDSEMALDYILYLKTLSKGLYNIDLYAYSGGCVSVATKQVEIVEDLGENPDDDGLGNDPLIREFTVNPNPNTGDFTVTVKLREVADINLVLFSVASGLKVNEQFEYQLQDYLVDYNLVNLNSGVYLLIVKAGNERRQVKIVIQ